MTASDTSVSNPRRPGLCDFVPEDGRFTRFATRHHPELQRFMRFLRQSGIDSLLEEQRLLALMELVPYAARQARGDVIELGVYKGGSAAAIAWALSQRGCQRVLHLCDTFEGLPESRDWEWHHAGDFADAQYETIVSRLRAFLPGFDFRFHRGLFAEALPSLPYTTFCFAHIDADLYDSVLQACEYVYPRMAKGGIIIFDDYGAPTCPGATRSVNEFFADKSERPTHIAKCAYGIRVGTPEFDFHFLLLRRALLPAALHSFRQLPRRTTGYIGRRISARLTSPRASRLLGETTFRITGHRPASAQPDLRRAKGILIVRPDEVGDVVLTSPFFGELRRNAPQAWITLIVKPEIKGLVELCPYVNEVLAFDWHVAPGFEQLRLHARALALAKRALWRRRFDLAILPRWDVDYYHATFLAYFSGAVCRVGYSEDVLPLKRQSNAGFDRLLTHGLDDRVPKHEVERNLDVLRFLGGTVEEDRLELWLSEEDRTFAAQTLAFRGQRNGELLIACSPGAGAAKRRWPIERFIDLGRHVLREFDSRVVVVGAADDRELGSRLQKELGTKVINLAGEATLRQTAAVLEHTRLMISNDAGPMHLAAAAGNPVVEISCHPRNGAASHANSPARFRPWGVPHVVLQPERAAAPCDDACEASEAHCILGVEVDRAEQAVRSLLSSKIRTAATSVGAHHDQ